MPHKSLCIDGIDLISVFNRGFPILKCELADGKFMHKSLNFFRNLLGAGFVSVCVCMCVR